ncbi:MAG: hypothetical protein ACJ8G3_19130 [Burkholderiaceae bacterium]
MNCFLEFFTDFPGVRCVLAQIAFSVKAIGHNGLENNASAPCPLYKSSANLWLATKRKVFVAVGRSASRDVWGDMQRIILLFIRPQGISRHYAVISLVARHQAMTWLHQ